MKRRTLGLLALTTPVIAACGGESSSTTTVAKTVEVTVTAYPTPEGEPSTEPSETGEPTANPESDADSPSAELRFGETYTSPKTGNKITLGKPTVITGRDFENPKFNEWVKVQITATNATTETIDPRDFMFQATSGYDEAEVVTYAPDIDVEAPTAAILPGRSRKWNIAVGRHKGKEFVVQVGYGFGTVGYWK